MSRRFWCSVAVLATAALASPVRVSNAAAAEGIEPRCTLATAPDARWQTRRENGAAWLVSPCGERLLSIGVNVLDAGASGEGSTGKHYDWRPGYPSRTAWADATRERLRAWGFNSAGAWSLAPGELALPGVIDLELGRNARFHWFDPFSPEMAAVMAAKARELTAPYRGSPWRIGYFSDNEVGWWSGALFTFYSEQSAASFTKRRLVRLLRDLYRDEWPGFVGDFVPPDGVDSWAGLLAATRPTRLRPGGAGARALSAWTTTVAEHYYRLSAAAIRQADPGALYFGDRLPIYYDPAAVRAAAPHVDVISVNYNPDAKDGWVAPYFFAGLRELTGGRPVLVSEWFFAARENRSGNRNNGHLMTVATQAERARGAAATARALAAIPEVLGLHWFQYYDYPSGGRADGEDYAFGLVDTVDRPYGELVAALGAANRELETLHAGSAAAPRGPASAAAAGGRRPASLDAETADARAAAPVAAAGASTGRGAPAGAVPAVGAGPGALGEGGLALPRAAISLADDSLADWPKPQTLVGPLVPAPGSVSFGEVYLAWDDRGLDLATIGQDYVDLDLLAYGGSFPLGETYRVEFGIDAGVGPRWFTLLFLPPRRSERDHPPMTPLLCRGTVTPLLRAPLARVGEAPPRAHGDDAGLTRPSAQMAAAGGGSMPPALVRVSGEVEAGLARPGASIQAPWAEPVAYGEDESGVASALPPREADASANPGCAPVAGAKVRYFGADQPRIVAEARVPWAALGLDEPPPAGHALRLEIAAWSWFRGRWMSLSGRPPAEALADPMAWRSAWLGGESGT